MHFIVNHSYLQMKKKTFDDCTNRPKLHANKNRKKYHFIVPEKTVTITSAVFALDVYWPFPQRSPM